MKGDGRWASIEAALVRFMEEALRGCPAGMEAPVRYAVLGAGKRLRPRLLLAAYRAAGGRHPRASELACSVELVHAYSLVHDDLPCMDDDAMRRGRPALHVAYGPEVAVSTGALLMPLAVRAVWRAGRAMELSTPRLRRLTRTLAEAAGAAGMVGGQVRDLEAEGRTVARPELERIHREKTAALIAAAVEMGGLAAGAPARTQERLRRYGLELGLAFQVVDDVLDCTGDPERMGKPEGRDAALGKATMSGLLGIEGARRLGRELQARALAALEGMDGVDELRELARAAVERSR